ncbi:hypothetical protein RFEPED_1258 [Rickettsia felis str. Pedreira]|uniref:Uncharacterized protein n=1 Tax=Rickettsia felis str. Pedreira TaxID=1359196 RepID=A0A0F3MWC0_RICFI|nr:hypothetical protein RFEPED_1258 [Rickettsia felis str. Pedreira]
MRGSVSPSLRGNYEVIDEAISGKIPEIAMSGLRPSSQ